MRTGPPRNPRRPPTAKAHITSPATSLSRSSAPMTKAPLFKRGIDGKGQTIIIVDSFGSPTVGHDLAVFDKTFGLPAPPSLTVIQPDGPIPPGNHAGWAGETELDVEYSHVMAPDASILLVETPDSETEGKTGFPAIIKAEEYVINHHLGGVISQSFSATEQSFASAQQLLSLSERVHRCCEEPHHRSRGIRRQRSGRRLKRRHLLQLSRDFVAGQRSPRHRGRRHTAAPERTGCAHTS